MSELCYEKLKSEGHVLIEYMEGAGYGKTYMRQVKRLWTCIVTEGIERGWRTYEDVFAAYAASGASKRSLEALRGHLRLWKRFIDDGEFPTRSKRSYLLDSAEFKNLPEEFQDLIYWYRENAPREQIKERTIIQNISSTISFFCTMQKCQCVTLSDINEAHILSHYVCPVTKKRIRTGSDGVRALLKTGISFSDECRRILELIPHCRRSRKNIDYLTEAEISRIETAVTDPESSLTSRERAVGMFLLRTPLRASDIASIRLQDIDWENDTIRFVQPKTGNPNTISLTAELGNAIFDYLSERPSCKDEYLFVSTVIPIHGISAVTINSNIVNKIYDAAAVRMNKGERRGTHLFRFRAVAAMLAGGVKRPVISKTLGHFSPNSLQPYLSADFAHLKTCALSIEPFPIGTEVPL